MPLPVGAVARSRLDGAAPPEHVADARPLSPLAAASLGQVHAARMHDGTEVVVKVQYPGVAEALRADLDDAAFVRKLAGAGTRAELDAVQDEMRDRFGRLPPSVDRLLRLARLRVEAAAHRIDRIEVEDGKVMLYRRNQLLTFENRLPRLKAASAEDRLDELRKLVGQA